MPLQFTQKFLSAVEFTDLILGVFCYIENSGLYLIVSTDFCLFEKSINKSRHEQNGCHFADIFQFIFLKDICSI